MSAHELARAIIAGVAYVAIGFTVARLMYFKVYKNSDNRYDDPVALLATFLLWPIVACFVVLLMIVRGITYVITWEPKSK